MKTVILIIVFLLLIHCGLYAQSGVTIHGGGAVTVNGNITIANGCGLPFTDIRDGRVYNTVMIGGQCWMAQNLNYGTRISGTSQQTNNSVPEKYCYSNLESNCDIYGGLYQWGETVQYLNGASNITSWSPVPSGNIVGLCPTGWHVPSEAEWTTMVDFLGGWQVAGGAMKEAGYSHWAIPNTGATNSSGFTALPGGNDYYYTWYDLRYFATFWTSTDYSATVAWWHGIWYDYASCIYETAYVKANGYSISCLKD